MRRFAVALLLVAACGSPVGGAGNCMELLEATIAAVNELPDADTPMSSKQSGKN